MRNIMFEIIGLILLGVVALTAVSSCTIVPAGHVGVPVLFGEVQNYTVKEGLSFINPFVVVHKLSIRLEEYTMSGKTSEGKVKGDDAIYALSQDGMTIKMEVTLWFALAPDRANDVYRNIGKQYIDVIVRSASRAVIREEAVLFRAEALWGTERLEFVKDATAKLKAQLEPKGIVIDRILVRDIEVPAIVKLAIEAKLKADQEAQQMKFVLLKEKQEAERKRIEAQGISDFQHIVSKGISPELLKWKAIEVAAELSKSPNAKIIVLGDKSGLPIILTDK